MPLMASSPPPTPSPQKKRKFGELNLGENQLARLPKAQRTYYGINIHRLLEDAQAEEAVPNEAYELPTPPAEQVVEKKASLLWTEKYRAKKFTDLLGDERTHRSVMHWLKRWDQIVFPGSYRPQKAKKGQDERVEERPLKKILMLTGPPGLGKTTLAHVCAKQAGYEVQEINASDERSSSVVKGRIRDMVGTENVKGVDTRTVDGKVRKAGKPVCVVVDEVDGVVGGGAGGEGGFIKALIDLILLDQKNGGGLSNLQQAPGRKRKGERFRMQRPLILICNDIYHPALRPLRQSSHAEVIHMRKPQIQMITARMQSIFDKEGVPCESDGVRRLCEAAWGVSNRKEDRGGNGAGEGDMRGIMVVGEWIAGKLRAEQNGTGSATLTRRWVEKNVLSDLSHGGGATRGLGRGGPKDIVERVFQEGAGFPKGSAPTIPSDQTLHTGARGVAEGNKRTATERLRELVDTHGETDRIMTDCFTTYPDHPFQDDTLLSKPSAAYDWLHFHDRLSSAVFHSQEWELAPYLSTPVLAFHHLFASPTRAQYQAQAQSRDQPAHETDETTAQPHPFTGPQAPWTAHETTKHNISLLETLHSSLNLDLTRAFTSTTTLATDLLPYLLRMLAPNVTPVIIRGSSSDKDKTGGTASVRKASEQQLLARSVQAMLACGVKFERTRVSETEDFGNGKSSWQAPAQWVYRMEPSLDLLGVYETGGRGFGEAGVREGKQRFAIRQVLEQEFRKEERKRGEMARQARFRAGASVGEAEDEDSSSAFAAAAPSLQDRLVKVTAVKRDFFGRVLAPPLSRPSTEDGATGEDRQGGQRAAAAAGDEEEQGRVWVTFHEGFSNAVRKPIGLGELMRGL
ncbi:hypothetical protein LTR62_004361 [Meristemomyces frigidus]|uniref:AAA+ ATPase domain-containing protein n=1 Tax=Meristemomyces frigidus TaxID=1508187 RepID=A0AAN7YPA5_9PEZI|nr:hypothetical protein LTR62_004361 [Meristemomyces frigidus]